MAAQLLTRARAAEIAPERPGDGARVERLIDAAFGPGRFAKTAERLREGNAPRLDLSFCAHVEGALVGAVRLWPVRIGSASAMFLGPIAVEGAWRRQGLGADLVKAACEAARAAGEGIVLLVGDPPFFGPLGFVVAPATVRLPGPVDPARVLWQALRLCGTDGVEGRVAPLPPEPRRA